jgi:hypothetical protein
VAFYMSAFANLFRRELWSKAGTGLWTFLANIGIIKRVILRRVLAKTLGQFPSQPKRPSAHLIVGFAVARRAFRFAEPRGVPSISPPAGLSFPRSVVVEI